MRSLSLAGTAGRRARLSRYNIEVFMLGALARGLFGTANDRVVKGFDKPVAKINALEPELAKLSDEQLRAKTTEFRERLAKGETVDDLLVEAFATVREAAPAARRSSWLPTACATTERTGRMPRPSSSPTARGSARSFRSYATTRAGGRPSRAGPRIRRTYTAAPTP